MNEEVYKLALVKHYSQINPLCITLEMPFLAGQRRADAVVVEDQLVHGIEIKSDRDKLDNLLSQASDYLRVFDFVWLLVSKNHLKNARRSLPNSVGLLVLEEGALKIKRKAKQIKRLDKRAISLSLDRSTLSALLGEIEISHHRSNGFDLLAKRLSDKANISMLRIGFRSQILRKYEEGYITFMRETGQTIHYEDLLNLGPHRMIR
ncbi:hypothetical protein SAMN04488073_0366 [Marinobacter gudaonensis]|uniref:Sce7726 family protein n=1 Tax=Marinobacter gudaonensis TaxID=375760 RepID=A0A1I6GB37_9GAMM|nr:sce7726 family protein [Marinobacter gudaonensis]SFR39388.1 hypothetical protein SAMN04488073_0366 [Marinobacter gudaonensis]